MTNLASSLHASAPVSAPIVTGSFFRSRFWRRFVRHRLAVVGSAVLLLLIFAALTAPIISPYPPHQIDVKALKQPPSAAHWLGTDGAGRDVLSRLIYAARISLSVGLVAAGIAIVIGTVLGLISGYYGGGVDFWIMRLTDVVMTIPTLIIIITVVAAVGPGIYNVMVVLGIFGWPGTCRLVRGEALSLREREFTTAARCLGVPRPRIVFHHILPNVVAPIIVAGTFFVASAILTEAALSFLGIGVQIPTATWGNMLTEAQSLTTLEQMAWLWIPPGLMITITVLSINFLGDALRDALDPRLTR
ncbi:MAG: ABC transporter permease [Caldilineaceae bacterium]|nr:ABC transporter permease [Caldilineaceae bacterium]